MAAGRHRGGYRDNGFRDREADFEVSQKENGYANGVYEVTRNGVHENVRGQGRVKGSLESGVRVRQNDIREGEVVNGRHLSITTRSNSGSSGSGGSWRRGLVIPAVDREPGELSSDGSDDAIDSDFQTDGMPEDKMMDDKYQLSPSQNKKRKFSPIVWDRDDGQVTRAIKSRRSAENSSLSAFPATAKSRSQTLTPNPSPDGNLSAKSHSQTPNSNPSPDGNLSAKSHNQTPNSNPSPDGNLSATFHSQTLNPNPSPDGNLQTLLAKTSSHETDIRHEHDVADFPAENSCMHPEEPRINMEIGVVNADDYVPMRTIISSRWANDADSPADEGEISNYEDTSRMKRKPGSDLAEVRLRSKSVSPEDGELKRGGSEETRGRSSGSDQFVRSSYRESYHDDMETDDDQNHDGSSINHSETESENGHSSPELACPHQRSVDMLHGCRSVDEFEKLNKINEGTYGVVYRARDKISGEIVALKKVKMEKEREGFPLTSLREINILLSFDYPSIVNVKEVVMGNLDSIFMVMEYMEHDLKALMETMKQPFSQSEVKCLMLQLLGGVKYLHDNWVLHRDLKTSNLLLNNCGELKICDFGLARQYGSPLKPYTHLVVTLWYRAPELLLGAKQYSTAIDMWSVGCIMAELLSKEPLFNGKTEFDQLDKIFRILGTPNEKIWPGFSKLPGVKVNFVKHQYNLLRRKFPATSFTGSPVLSDAGFDLLSKLLTYDPEKRITAEAALNHEWFREVPLPKSKEFMPTFPAQHVQDRYMRRVIKSPDPLEEQRRKELQQEVLGTTGLFGQ